MATENDLTRIATIEIDLGVINAVKADFKANNLTTENMDRVIGLLSLTLEGMRRTARV